MQRWHEKTCLKPGIEILPDKTPHCRTCNASPRIGELVLAKAGTSSVPVVPPDGPQGQLRLWWPPSVPYSTSSRPSLTETSEAGSPRPVATDQIQQTVSYTSSLEQDQFRLISLPAVEAYDDPLHVTLEVFDLRNCPEYETVSYTWAGEDGDSSLCQPIYIGPFWDILLQTKNCWEMLRFARPWRGVRILWVDAICIDQSNLQERNSQVAHMGQIYSACSRVIIYLGPDIAVPLHGRYPRRARLHELESGNTVPAFPSLPEDEEEPAPSHRLDHLLKRRYFSRIWIIQELLLSQRIVMRVGDVDFWADPAMATHFSADVPEWNWERTGAAWVKHIAQGLRIKDLGEILLLTARSQATDPRDRIFGLLGVLPGLSALKNSEGNDGLAVGGLQADYSLSTQHVFVGLFAYCLLNMRQPIILHHASCLRVPNYPSWAPDWRVSVTWNLLFKSPKFTSDQVFDEVNRIVEATHNTAEESFKLYKLKEPGRDYIAKERPWHRDAHIDSSSGALRLNLTHFMAVSSPLEPVGKMGGFSVFVMNRGKFAVYFLSEHRLDLMMTGAEQDQLFVLDSGVQGLIYLVLRPIAGIMQKRYQLIATCPFVMMRMPTLPRANEIPTLRALSLQDLQYSRYDAVSDLRKRLEKNLTAHLTGLIPGPKTYREMLPLLLLLRTQQQEGVTKPNDEFQATYLQHINPDYQPVIDRKYVYILILNSWDNVCDNYFDVGDWIDRLMSDNTKGYEYRADGTDKWAACLISASKFKKMMSSGREIVINIRFPLKWLYKELTRLGSDVEWVLVYMDRILQSRNHVGDLEEERLGDVLREEPGEEDRFVGCVSGRSFEYTPGSELWKELGIGGSTYLVTIE